MAAATSPVAEPGGKLVPGRWFDGLSSQAKPVLVGLQPTPKGPSLALHPLSQPGATPTVFTWGEVGWPEAWSERRPQQRVVVDLRDHGSLEIDAVAQWHAALAAAGGRPSLAGRMQTRWPVLLGVTAVAIVGLTLFYRYGTPWAATELTRFVPVSWEASVASNVLTQMDKGTLKPSKLSKERQAQLQARFDTLVQQVPTGLQRYPGYRPTYTLSFRSGMGANAFALPGGTVVMTDGLAKAAEKQGLDDDALIGVLAHEIGHVAQRHTTRMIVQQGVLQMGMGLALGDVSGIVATGASVLTGLAYSRNHEREADCFAIALMGHAKLPTAPMGKLLLAIAKDEDGEEKAEKKKTATAAKEGASAPAETTAPRKDSEALGPVWSLLSSHPDTVERAKELEQGHALHCPKPA
ncbi:Zn-dependent protease with chaperone function [Acidovorax sp. CF316]|uniref:M48 family metallopeptidase n=1 Tax=Acidovorax sp. CF316 TaxID=1144317 RepID=UPI00026BEDB6|nr:M48 family metallopeptidase [Acidovorax sp. CF316]EJE50855.1 Zn-dependent protease with chaperone function [Acidovorax sp. CF316]